MRILYRLKTLFITQIYGFKSVGKNTVIYKPMQINNPQGIRIGYQTSIYHYAWLMGPKDGGELFIGDRTTIGHFAHIIAARNVNIGSDVLIADRVFITDCTHSYENVDMPIQNQPIFFLKPVLIGEGSWLGENVCVCGASIGKHCIIGANSIVKEDIPNYCVAVGNPARVVKKYNFEHHRWE